MTVELDRPPLRRAARVNTTPTVTSPGFEGNAVCSGLDLTVFYGEEERSMTPAELAETRAVCRYCPARVDCLREALVTSNRFGIWGGYTVRERRRILALYTDQKVYSLTESVEMALPVIAAGIADGSLDAAIITP